MHGVGRIPANCGTRRLLSCFFRCGVCLPSYSLTHLVRIYPASASRGTMAATNNFSEIMLVSIT